MISPIVDISHHQADPINFGAALLGGVVGLFHKASEGGTYTDAKFHERRITAAEAGLLFASYHFMTGSDVEAQMDHYLATVEPVHGERVVLDHENQYTTLTMLEHAVAYLSEVRPDLRITIYSGHLIKEQLAGKRSPLLADYTTLWIAHYTSSSQPSWPKETWPQWSLWQWTDKEKIPGFTVPVDGDRWNGSEAELRAFMAPAATEAPAPIEPVPPSVPIINIVVTGDVRVIVNGEIIR